MKIFIEHLTERNYQKRTLGLIENGSLFAEKSVKGREKIAETALDFIQDGSTILSHCNSRVVMTLLLNAARHNRRFNVLVTEARPTCKGYEAAKTLRENGIQASVILDAAVGYYIDRVDAVLVGAEGVVENGGIINQVCTIDQSYPNFYIFRLERI